MVKMELTEQTFKQSLLRGIDGVQKYAMIFSDPI